MRKSIVLALSCLLSASTTVHAGSPEYPDDLKVMITNLGQEKCVLSNQTLFNGSFYNSGLPFVIPGYGQTQSFTLTGFPTTKLEVTYKCGEDKEITLHMTQFHKKNHHHTSIKASSSNAIGINEGHDSKVTMHNRMGGYHQAGHNYPGTLNWNLMF